MMARRLWGRVFQPAALCLTITAAASGVNRLVLHTNAFYAAVGVFALIVAAVMLIAWWARRPRWMRAGMLASTVLWVFVAGTSWTIIHSPISAFNALALSILAAGSYWLETDTGETR